jgi:hypothetical protein
VSRVFAGRAIAFQSRRHRFVAGRPRHDGAKTGGQRAVLKKPAKKLRKKTAKLWRKKTGDFGL